ncbi:MAG: DUF4097 domain-containing protein [Clostridiales bacterium]|nr:DUF4097 domain-containing protein [Clostridiales bacterium]
MKIKGFILTGLTVAVLGFIVFAVAMSNLDWKFSINGNYEQKAYTVEGEEALPAALELRADYADVTVERGEETKIEYDDSNKLGYAFSVSDGKLTVTQTQKRSFFRLWLFRDKKPKIKVTVSSDCAAAVVKVQNGTLTVSDESFKALTVENKNGKIVLKSVDADSATVVNVNGDIEMDGFVCRGDLSVTNKNGDIGIRNSSVDGALGVVDKNGDVVITQTSCPTVNVNNGNGDIRLTEIAAGKLIATAHNGDIKGNKIDCPDIYAKNHNGDTKFSVVGSAADYVIVTKCSNGDVHAPQSGSGEKRIELINRNGDIDLSFEAKGSLNILNKG